MFSFFVVIGNIVINCIGGVGCIQSAVTSIEPFIRIGLIELIFELPAVVKIYAVIIDKVANSAGIE